MGGWDDIAEYTLTFRVWLLTVWPPKLSDKNVCLGHGQNIFLVYYFVEKTMPLAIFIRHPHKLNARKKLIRNALNSATPHIKCAL